MKGFDKYAKKKKQTKKNARNICHISSLGNYNPVFDIADDLSVRLRTLSETSPKPWTQ